MLRGFNGAGKYSLAISNPRVSHTASGEKLGWAWELGY